MKKFLKENWREIAGWIAVAILWWVFIQAGTGHYYGRLTAFEHVEAALLLVVVVLSWLRLNKNKSI